MSPSGARPPSPSFGGPRRSPTRLRAKRSGEVSLPKPGGRRREGALLEALGVLPQRNGARRVAVLAALGVGPQRTNECPGSRQTNSFSRRMAARFI